MEPKLVAILQSNYIPWKGYFDLINRVDEFIFYDDMQYTKRDWRNRNQIKTATGPLWLSIPVNVKGRYFQKINETKVQDSSWVQKHWKTIKQNYSKASCFDENEQWVNELFSQCEKLEYISDINFLFISKICSFLKIDTKISKSSNYQLADGKTERLINLCQQAEATEYLSGPAAKDYIVEEQFLEAQINLQWMDYSNYQEYKQLYPPFTHYVSVLDMIFNLGTEAPRYIKG